MFNRVPTDCGGNASHTLSTRANYHDAGRLIIEFGYTNHWDWVKETWEKGYSTFSIKDKKYIANQEIYA